MKNNTKDLPFSVIQEKQEFDAQESQLHESLQQIQDKSMSILDCSLNLDPKYTSNNLYLEQKIHSEK